MTLSTSLVVFLLSAAVGEAPDVPSSVAAASASEEDSTPVASIVRGIVGGIAPGSVQALSGSYAWAAVFAGIEVAAGLGMAVASIVVARGTYLLLTNILWSDANEVRASRVMLLGGGSLLAILPLVALLNRGSSAAHAVWSRGVPLLPE